VLDDDALLEAVGRGATGEGCQIIFHLAAIGSVPRSVANPQRSWSVNATGTVRVLVAATAKPPSGPRVPVERVVRAIVHALCARRPKTRYPLGGQPRVMILLS
ncbi:MAG: NAD-dependent epimerase/dehydratase family protein, partial [Phycisphaerales bacterium]|nr:NAD-dependent epimerase/dehydratase family protein [Phycisphaerales bacterium]